MRTIFMNFLASLILASYCAIGFAQQNDALDAKLASKPLPLYNIFYLSKYIGDYEGLNNKQRQEIRDQLITQPKFDKLDPAVLNKMPKVQEFLNNVRMDKSQALFNSLTKTPGPSELLRINRPTGLAFTDLKELEKAYENIISGQKFIKDNKVLFESLKVYSNNKQKLDSEKPANEIPQELKKEIDKMDISLINNPLATQNNLYGQIERLRKELNSKPNYVDSILSELQLYIEEIPKALQQYTDTYEDNAKIYSEKYVDSFSISVSILNYNFQETTDQSITTQIHLSNNVQAAQQGLSYSGINLPSQSQMIEAMAMFLAKRAKQEAAIWFMDELRNRVKNPLIQDVFPNTIAMINVLDGYRTASFGKSWRYAISKDFVNLPKNIINSSWTSQYLSIEQADDLSTAVNFAYDLERLITERYNYRDIIRYFYLNPDYKLALGKGALKLNIQNSFSALYIITNELFSITNINGNNTFRLLSYEEINSLNETQWEVLIELLEHKYKDEFNDLPKLLALNKDELTKWVSSLLIALSQFDKINREQQALLQDKGNFETSNQSLTTSLKILKQVVYNLDFSALSKSTKTKTFNEHIILFSDVMEILENIQLKNFVAASRKTLAIIDSYGTQSKLFNGKFEGLKFSNGEPVFKNLDCNPLLSKINFTKFSKFDSLNITFNTEKTSSLELSKQQQNFIKTYEKTLRKTPKN